jgi:hypothetical protein
MYYSRDGLLTNGRQKRAEKAIKTAQNNIIGSDFGDVAIDDFVDYCRNPDMLFHFYSTFGFARKIINIPAKWMTKNFVTFTDKTIQEKSEEFGLRNALYDWVRYSILFGQAYLLVNKKPNIILHGKEVEQKPEVFAINNTWIQSDDPSSDFVVIYDYNMNPVNVSRKYLVQMQTEDNQSALLPMMAELHTHLQSQYGILKYWQAAAIHVVKSTDFDKMNKANAARVAERLNILDSVLSKRRVMAIGQNDSYERIGLDVKIRDYTDWMETLLCSVSEIPRILLFDKSPTGGVNDAKAKGSNFTNFISNIKFSQNQYIKKPFDLALFKIFGNKDISYVFNSIMDLNSFENEELKQIKIDNAGKLLDIKQKLEQQNNNIKKYDEIYTDFFGSDDDRS